MRLVSRVSVRVTIDAFVGIPPWRAYDELIREASVRYRLDPVLVRAVMQAESAFDPFAVSRAGALGLMQLMPDVATEYGVDDPFDPRENIMAGARHLRQLIDMQEGDMALALASYNAGPGTVAKYGGTVPPYPETQDYVTRITRLVERTK